MMFTEAQAQTALDTFKDRMWRDGEIPGMQAALTAALQSAADTPAPSSHVQPVEVCLWLADLIVDARLDGRSAETDPEWTAREFTQHRAYQRILAAISPAPETNVQSAIPPVFTAERLGCPDGGGPVRKRTERSHLASEVYDRGFGDHIVKNLHIEFVGAAEHDALLPSEDRSDVHHEVTKKPLGLNGTGSVVQAPKNSSVPPQSKPGGLVELNCGSEQHLPKHSPVLGGDFETGHVNNVVGQTHLRNYLPRGLDGIIVGVVEVGKLSSLRIFPEDTALSDMEVVPRHSASIEPMDHNSNIRSGFSPSPPPNVGLEGEAYLSGHKEDGGFARGAASAVIRSRYAASSRASLNSIGTDTVASPPLDLITTYVSDEDLRRLNWHQQSPFPTDDSISISETISSTINPFTALNCALNQEITVALYLALVVDGNFETQISSFYEHEVKRSSYRHYSSGGSTATTALSLGRTPAPQMMATGAPVDSQPVDNGESGD